MEEEFIDVIGFSKYQINKIGQIINKKTKKYLKYKIDKDGYFNLSLYDDDNNKKYMRVHRLVAINFIPNPNNYQIVDHIDRNRQNNNIENLRWGDSYLNNRNSNIVLNATGTIIEIKNINKTKTKYWRATYSIDYQIKKTKTSKDIEICENWLNEMRLKHPRKELN